MTEAGSSRTVAKIPIVPLFKRTFSILFQRIWIFAIPAMFFGSVILWIQLNYGVLFLHTEFDQKEIEVYEVFKYIAALNFISSVVIIFGADPDN